MDPLSNVLSLLKPRNYLSAGLDAGGAWAIQFPDQEDGIKTGAVVRGQCWLSVEGEPKPVHLVAGDCFLLPSGRPFRLATDLSLRPVAASAIFGAPRPGSIATHNGGGDFSLVSNRFALTGGPAGHLMRMLPPIVHVREPVGQAVLRWSVEQMMAGLRNPQPGSVLIIEHLAQMMLVQALRLHLSQSSASGVGWLFALADPQMNAVLTAIHEDPAQRWTLHSLARRAGMSRSGFAVRFKEAVGATPMDYLVKWRMLIAAARLRETSTPVAAIAPSVGYQSEAAFSTAFRRVMGCSPRHYAQVRWEPVAMSGVSAAPGSA